MSAKIDEYEEYICIGVRGHQVKYEDVLKTTIKMHLSDEEVTEENLKFWLGYEIQFDGQESLEDIHVFKPEKDFDLLAYISENELTFHEEFVSPYNTIIHFSSKGQTFVVYMSVVAQWMIDLSAFLEHKRKNPILYGFSGGDGN